MEPENQNTMHVAPPIAVAPPTEAAPLAVASRVSSWPTTLGIIAIIFGAGALLTTAGSLVSTEWSQMQNEQMGPDGVAMMKAVQDKWRPFTVGASAIHLLLGVLILYAGILLLKRRRFSARLIRWWSPLKIVSEVVNTVVGYVVARETMPIMAANTPGLPAMGQIQDTFLFLGVLLALAWGCALPIFMLIWLSRNRIKEEIIHWS